MQITNWLKTALPHKAKHDARFRLPYTFTSEGVAIIIKKKTDGKNICCVMTTAEAAILVNNLKKQIEEHYLWGKSKREAWEGKNETIS